MLNQDQHHIASGLRGSEHQDPFAFLDAKVLSQDGGSGSPGSSVSLTDAQRVGPQHQTNGIEDCHDIETSVDHFLAIHHQPNIEDNSGQINQPIPAEAQIGYSLENFKWGSNQLGSESGTLTVSVDLSGLDFNSNLYSLTDFEGSLNKAFDAWERVADVDFELTENSNANIEVDVSPLSGSTIGLTTVSYSTRNGFDRINSSDITFDGEERWSPDGETGQDFFAVALHEIGHAFGLGHINDPDQIMNPVIFADELGNGDIEGAQELYGTDPDDVMVSPDFDDLDGNQPTADEGSSETSGSEALPDDDDGGGLVAILLGGLIALLAAMFGGGGGGVAVLAAKSDDPLNTPEYKGSGTTLSDIGPTYEVPDHAAGCACGCQTDIVQEENGFTLFHEVLG